MNTGQRERLRKLNELRSQVHDAYMIQHRETIQLMRRRHSHYSALIKDAGIMTAEIFYNRFREHFAMYGVELTLTDDKRSCSIYLDLGYGDYEKYLVIDGKAGKLAEVSPIVSFEENFYSREANIFEEDTI